MGMERYVDPPDEDIFDSSDVEDDALNDQLEIQALRLQIQEREAEIEAQQLKIKALEEKIKALDEKNKALNEKIKFLEEKIKFLEEKEKAAVKAMNEALVEKASNKSEEGSD